MAAKNSNPFRQRTHPTQSLGAGDPSQNDLNEVANGKASTRDKAEAFGAGVIAGRLTKRRKKKR